MTAEDVRKISDAISSEEESRDESNNILMVMDAIEKSLREYGVSSDMSLKVNYRIINRKTKEKLEGLGYTVEEVFDNGSRQAHYVVSWK